MGTENPTQVHSTYPTIQFPGQQKIYIPAKHRETIEEIKKALERDGSSLSSFILEQLLEWWEKHKPGNPQLSLERYDPSSLEPGPGIPGSIYYRDRLGEWHWGWLHQLPYERLQWVDREGKAHWIIFPEPKEALS
jgi:hypothetical protein